MKLASLCVFCGSRSGAAPVFGEAARSLGTLLAEQGITVVYGGARIGLMGAVADSALAAGGRVIGVIPEAIAAIEIAHEGLTELHRVGSMHERKALMAELSDGFVALPGGLGTLEELFEVWTWAQLAIHAKPIGLLNVEGFYDSLLAFVAQQEQAGFVNAQHRALLQAAPEPAALLERLAATPPPTVRFRDKLEP